jgi:myo-inositol-1(or 4)-monophosphatase
MHPYVNIGIQAARRAGKVITRYYEQLDASKVSEKGLRDLVTIADQAAEKIIIEMILKAYPAHNILAEETGLHPGFYPGNEWTWIIDPIDATMNFVHGFPQFAVSIGVQHKNHMEHAIIYDPLSQELFTASRGEGAQLNERRIRVSNQETLRHALVALDFSNPPFAQALFKQGADGRKNGCAVLNLAYIAAGRLDGFIEDGLKPWDIAAGILMVREAGGFVSDFEGANNCLDNGEILAGTRKVHTELLEMIKANRIQL